MTDRRLVRALPISVVVLIAAVGLILVASGHWRRGAAVLGASAWAGALLRLTVRDSAIGPLGVRGRVFDVFFLVACGLLFTLGATLGF